MSSTNGIIIILAIMCIFAIVTQLIDVFSERISIRISDSDVTMYTASKMNLRDIDKLKNSEFVSKIQTELKNNKLTKTEKNESNE